VTGPASFELRDIVAGPPGDPILRGVSLDIPCRGVTAFAGPSGAGKSTLLRLLNRLDDPVAGGVRLEGRDLVDWDPRTLRRRVAMVFQRPPLFAGTVLDNLRVAVPELDRGGGAAALARVGLGTELLDRAAADLSGGEAQRMCIARALLTEPAVLLADEPTSSLDGAARRTIEELTAGIAATGVAVVWVTHDVEQLRRIADHVVVIVDGAVAATGHLPELDEHADPRIRALVGAA
jgi:putative ABC transport system ATP-binding protein